jgi:hypothetical protein
MFSKLKRPPTEWEKRFASCTSDNGVITITYKELKKLNSRKINEPMKKCATFLIELNRSFTKEEVQTTKKHMRKCSPSLVIKEMQIKTTLRFLLTPARTASIKNTISDKCCQE